VVPLRLVAIAGALIVLVSSFLALYALTVAIRGIGGPGWVSTVLPIYALGGFQILTLGIVAEYVGRITPRLRPVRDLSRKRANLKLPPVP